MTKHGVSGYYIPPYQRGYKWSDDMVGKLITDLYEAFTNGQDEYYLQFITVKVANYDNKNVLEVIDGQQRLTTLTLLLSYFAYQKEDTKAISNDLLTYAIRDKVTAFFERYIYGDLSDILLKEWNDYINDAPKNDEQDIFYLFRAIKTIEKSVGKEKKKIEDRNNFERYVLNNVKIILNKVDDSIGSEELFTNLNSNKVELTDLDLVKGLFLTKSVREVADKDTSYKEILSKRAIMGRQWDELAHWCNDEAIKNFYFKKDIIKGTDSLLSIFKILAVKNGDTKSNLKLFDFFETQLKKDKKSISQYFNELKAIQRILNDWYNDTQIYNLIGYLFVAKNHNLDMESKEIIDLLSKNKDDVKQYLKNETLTLLPESDNIEDLYFNNTEDKTFIFNLLLALSVFQNQTIKFSFDNFNKNSWSLEHIFPQTIPEKIVIQDIILIKKLLKYSKGDFKKAESTLNNMELSDDAETVYDSIFEKLENTELECLFDDDEKKVLNSLIKTEKLHNIGNLALLTKPDNSSNKNGLFNKKRHNIVERISKGSFVPKHTYDVFSKLLDKHMDADLSVWTENDIDKHLAYIIKTTQNIKTELQ